MRARRREFTAQFYRGNRLRFALAALSTLLMALLNLALAWLLQQMLDSVSGVPGAMGLTELALLSAAAVALVPAVKALELCSKPQFLRRAMEQYRCFAFQRLTQKSIAAFGTENTALYLSALSNDAATIEKSWLETQFDLILNAVSFAGALAMMLAYSPAMTLISCAFFLLPAGAALAAGGRAERAEARVSERSSAFVAALKDCLSGFSVMKSFKAEAAICGLFAGSCGEMERAKCEKRRLMTVIGTLAGAAGVTAQLGTFLAGAWLALSGRGITPGVLIVFIDLTASIINPIRQLPEQLAARRAAAALIDRLAAALGENVRDEGGGLVGRLERGIELEGLSFSYGPGGEALSGLDFRFEAGRSYAVVGASGSGKSTLLALLMAGHGGYSGQIRYDGRELRSLSAASVYDAVSIIQQDVFIFNASIRDNVTMFLDFSDEEVERALRLSGLSELIAGRGADYLCGENGAGLSGGEKQRVSIARSLLKRSQVLLVDEATAALDPAAAFQVSSAILGLEGMTRIVVTHDLEPGLLGRYDCILAMKGGRIAEYGSFAELMERRGCFYSLFTLSR